MKAKLFLIILYSLLIASSISAVPILLDEYTGMHGTPEAQRFYNWAGAYGMAMNITENITTLDTLILSLNMSSAIGDISGHTLNITFFNNSGGASPVPIGNGFVTNLTPASTITENAWNNFTFTGVNIQCLNSSGNYYYFVFTDPSYDTSNYVRLILDSTANTGKYDGSAYGMAYRDSGSWNTFGARDFHFMLWKIEGINDTTPPLISNPICTSCASGINSTVDSTPTINVTVTDYTGIKMVRIANNSAYNFSNATSSRDCTAGSGSIWVCTVASSDALPEGSHAVYLWANDTGGYYHTVYNLTMDITVDTITPVMHITSPVNSTSYIVSSIDLNWTYYEANDLGWCAYSLDDEANDTSIFTTITTFSDNNATGNLTLTFNASTHKNLSLNNESSVISATIDLRGYESNITYRKTVDTDGKQGFARLNGTSTRIFGMSSSSSLSIYNATDVEGEVCKTSLQGTLELTSGLATADDNELFTLNQSGTTYRTVYNCTGLLNCNDEEDTCGSSWADCFNYTCNPLFTIQDADVSGSSDTMVGIASKNGDDIYVTAFTNKSILKYNRAGTLQSRINLSFVPQGIHFDGTYFYVCESNTVRIRQINTSGINTKNYTITNGDTCGYSLHIRNTFGYDYAYIGEYDLGGSRMYDFASYPTNLTIKTNNEITYQNLSTFNGSVDDIDLNVSSLQDCIDACSSPSGSDCLCEINFTSSTVGILEYSDIKVVLNIPTNITLTSLSEGSHNVTIYCNDTVGNMGQSNYTYFSIDSIPPLLSNAVCTTCIGSTNRTADSTPIINVTATDTIGVQMVRIANNSAYNFSNANATRNCTIGTGDVWVCTLNSLDKLTDTTKDSVIYFWANDTLNHYHIAFNLSINLSYELPYFNITSSLSPNMTELLYPVNWSRLNLTAVINHTTGNFTWNLTEYNISAYNLTDWVFNVTNEGNVIGNVTLWKNQTKNWYEWWCYNGTYWVNTTNTSQPFYTGIAPLSSIYVNCTLNVINISETYVNWSVTIDRAIWDFNYTFNAT